MARFFSPNSRSLLVPVIIGLNVAVFLMWGFGGTENLQFMLNNFTVSWTGLSEGRFWILLTSVFSHNMFFHIFINMYVLLSFGSILEQVLGRAAFLNFYLMAGIVSSFTHAFVSAALLGAPDQPAVGASGAIAGLILVFSLMFPKQKLLIFGLIPIPAIWGAFAFIGLDLWGLFAQAQGGGLPIGHGAHLGGAAMGLFYYLFILRHRWRR